MKAMILAAGKGERLQPLTNHTPKPLIKVAGKSVVEHTISNLVKMGIEDIVINTWHLADKLTDFVGSGNQWGAKVLFSNEDRLLNTGGGVRNALDKLGDGPTILVNGDILWSLDLQPLLTKYNPKKMDAMLGLTTNPHYKKSDFSCKAEGGNIQRAEGKDDGYTYTGIMIFSPQTLLKYPLQPFSLNRFFDDKMVEKRLFGLPLHGEWADMGTHARLAQVQKEWGVSY
ncbi:MAG: nucleotidyltransferase family protein [Magnetococcales bacterium]|nr:nucleotidyltransferase family protein [Magnetococcales bacterium]